MDLLTQLNSLYRSTPRKILVVLLLQFFAFIVLSLFFTLRIPDNEKPGVSQCHTNLHKYINPELDCINTDIAYANINKSEENTRTFVNSQIKSGDATRIAVFFRDLKTKKWYGINENQTFSPGSLLKLPLAITYFKLSEIDPVVLQMRFVFDKPNDLNSLQHFNSAKPLIVGGNYSVSDFLSRLIIDSDNAVVPTLINGIDGSFYNKVLVDLGVNIPLSDQGGTHADFFSPKSYAAILRVLYNSSYLDIEHSEKILELLSSSTFKEGLVSGVPAGTKIAHKFGEATQIDPTTKTTVKHELHDCGIIYRQDNPYILCVMTEGSDFQSLENIIAEISKITWEDNPSITD